MSSLTDCSTGGGEGYSVKAKVIEAKLQHDSSHPFCKIDHRHLYCAGTTILQ